MDESFPIIEKPPKFTVQCLEDGKVKDVSVARNTVSFLFEESLVVIPRSEILEAKCLKILPFPTCLDMIYIRTKSFTWWFEGDQCKSLERALS